MIKTVVGNLLDAEESIIVHQVNCRMKMGSGIALQIKNKYPSAYDDYMNLSKTEKPEQLLGKVIMSQVGDNKYVAHLFGQLNYGYDGKKYTSYDALHGSLTKLNIQAQKANKSIAIPFKLGSDRGGADWDVVYKMIEKIFGNYDVTIYKLEEK